MNIGKVRIVHRRLGISIAFFLIVQVVAGLLMSTGKLASVDTSQAYNVIYAIHADWDPLGSIYRTVLGLAATMQVILGIMISFSRWRFKTGDKAISSIPPSPDQPYEHKQEIIMSTLSFAADIRPLFRDKDIAAMKPNGIDLSSYEDVRKHAQDINSRLSDKEMPCDEPWSDGQVQKFKAWMQSGMKP
jgi:succinate dehydrogenase/fumarate reductase cytochrome b subunit